MIKKKITLELDYEVEDVVGSFHARLTHPDIEGQLILNASSRNLIELQLNHLNADKESQLDPIQSLIFSTNKLVMGITELKDTLKK